MKEGYIVWNESTVESEFFGVYRTEKKAEKALRKVAKNRLGRCPRDYDKMMSALDEYGEGYDSYHITYFCKNGG